jgi:hypothetical protein
MTNNGYEALSITGSGVATPTVPALTQHCWVTIESSSAVDAGTYVARMTDDGSSPSTSAGKPLADKQEFYYTGTVSAMKFAKISGNVVIHLMYYK